MMLRLALVRGLEAAVGFLGPSVPTTSAGTGSGFCPVQTQNNGRRCPKSRSAALRAQKKLLHQLRFD